MRVLYPLLIGWYTRADKNLKNIFYSSVDVPSLIRPINYVHAHENNKDTNYRQNTNHDFSPFLFLVVRP